ncbi:hypothetical protein [Prevotella sp. OH937_COT-195]|uniref:hypothetical protein n=1 Tax=Prevotella sp. OH937_COT-195 TaxID=2491051 RepID=UPI000F64B138|nr:hypothetical protein [Prevotella sp. OH937_COT-195]RRC98416.1 hypothetical protein EII32_09240 [Prevotella sp. OH937_COT-195]
MKKYNLLLLAIIMVTSLGAQTKNDYNILVHKNDGQVVTVDASEVDSISFFEMPPINTGDDFTIEADEITSSSIKLTITPKDKNSTFYTSLLYQEAYDKAWDKYGSIYDMDKAWWQFLAENSQKDWLEILPLQVKKGVYQFNGREEYGYILWDNVYYAYCYGLNEQGEMTTPYYIKKYKTPMPIPSNNVLNVESITPDINNKKVKVKVTATNNDQYFICAQRKSYVDFWLNKLGSVDAMFKNLINQLAPTPDYFYKGSQEIDVYCAKAYADYVLILCGFDGGPTTEIKLEHFKNAPSDD